MLTESLLLASLGALFGAVIAYIGSDTLVGILASGPEWDQLNIDIKPDLNVFLFTACVTVIAAVLFGLAPAWFAYRSAAAPLRDVGKGGGQKGRLFDYALVAAQVAVSVLLVSAATMLVGHVSRMRNFDLGFSRDNVLLVRLDSSKTGLKQTEMATRLEHLLERLRHIAGVQSAGVGGCTPIQGCGAMRFVIVGDRPELEEARRRVSLNWVSPGYFDALGVPLRAGRDFRMQDVQGQRVAIINEAMAATEATEL